MAFTNSPEFEDDFRKAGPDATAGFAPAGSPSNPTEHAGSENLYAAGDAEEEEDDLEDDGDLDDGDLDDEDDDEDDDLEEDDEDDDLDDEDEDEDDLDEEDDDEDEDDLEDDDDAVKARLSDAEKRVRAA